MELSRRRPSVAKAPPEAEGGEHSPLRQRRLVAGKNGRSVTPVLYSRQGLRQCYNDKSRDRLRKVAEGFINNMNKLRRLTTRYDKPRANIIGFARIAFLATMLTSLSTLSSAHKSDERNNG